MTLDNDNFLPRQRRSRREISFFQSEGIRVGRFNESPITNRLLLIIDTSPYGGFKLVYYSNGLPICSPSNGNKLRSLDSDTK